MTFPYTYDLPLVPIGFYYAGRELTVNAIVDSGSTVSVLPYDIGLDLGLVWSDYTDPFDLGGAYKGTPANGVLVRGELLDTSMALAFAWVQRSDVRLILGHYNFFHFFEVRFRTWESSFELIPRGER
jgi:hypothetical protein